MDEFEKFYNASLRFLSYRPRSEKEIRDKLQKFKIKKTATTETQKKIERQNFSGSENFSASVVAREALIIEAVIAKLKEQNFINDEEFVKWWVEQRTTFKPKSLRVIKLELWQKGIPKEIIDKIISNDLEQAKKLVKNRVARYKGLPKEEIYQKLGSFLARRGFDYDMIKQSIDEVLGEGV